MYSSPPVSENHDSTRLTVADILSTMASSVDAMTPTTLSLLDGLTGVPTRTTPTLTPTTLRNIEQTFMDLAANQISHEHEAGFVPPLVPSNTLPYSSASSSNYTVTVTTSAQGPVYSTHDIKSWASNAQNQNSVSTVSSRATTRRMSVGSNSSSSNGSSYGSSSNTVSFSSSTRKSGGRRREDRELDDHGNPDEVVKRKMRRERNKLAAARCRKRRLDHTMALQQEVDLWEEKKQGIQNEIRQLQKEKEELEVLLETHRTGPSCKHRRTAGSGGSNLPSFCGVRAPPAKNSVQPVIKQELQESDDSYSSESENNHLDASFDIQQQHLAPAAHRSLLLTQQQPQLQPQQPQRMEFTKPAPRPRPTSLPVASPFSAQPRTSTAATSNEIAGISISTPSSGIPGLNFESLMDGGTGLTPVVPTPSCSSQQMRSSALPVDLSSPESVNRKLVSL